MIRSAIAAVGFLPLLIAGMGHAQNLPYPPHPLFPAIRDQETPCELQRPGLDDRSNWNVNLWPGGIVPYSLDANVSTTNANRLRLAMNELETVCNIQFVPRVNQANHILVQSGNNNSSALGMRGGLQNLSVTSWTSRYTICHELMHALAVHHEHERPDRYEYVYVNYANIQSGYESQFSFDGIYLIGAYDFESIMHYSPCSFSKCCPAGASCACAESCRTIDVLPQYASKFSLMGNRDYMSAGDKNGLVQRYGAPVDDAFAPNSTFATAKQINLDTTYTMKLLAMNDFFKVVVPQSTTLVVRAEATNVWGASNARLRVHNATGSQLSQAFFATSAGVTGATISRALTPGTYAIEVLRTQPWGGSYTLSATASCKPLDFTGDNLVTDTDFVIFLNAYNLMLCSEPAMPAGCPADINKDGMVDDTDFLFFSVAYDTMDCP